MGFHYTKFSKGVRKRVFSSFNIPLGLVLDVDDDCKHGLTSRNLEQCQIDTFQYRDEFQVIGFWPFGSDFGSGYESDSATNRHQIRDPFNFDVSIS